MKGFLIAAGIVGALYLADSNSLKANTATRRGACLSQMRRSFKASLRPSLLPVQSRTGNGFAVVVTERFRAFGLASGFWKLDVG